MCLFTFRSHGICVKLVQNKCKMNHWSRNLIKSMQDPSSIVIKNDLVVVIRDKYPKARHHFLVLPYESIDDIYQLRKCHLPLLAELELMGKNAVEVIGGKLSDFKMGYHAQPSMKRLHLHVISDDFISPCIKSKHHWNTFTTDFFIPTCRIKTMLETMGRVQRLPESEIKALLKRDLQCHKCSYKADNLPNLKNHLLIH
ncbi:aprataxin-like protein [Phlebotomus argentipes]|uniref:aprataxin-like protein n=1 Tax=Phlebotomus argentipes TaxID=94469 RepID=UPI0028932954|nr:aprataxin-like protein [Phlebotomus argentipes]